MPILLEPSPIVAAAKVAIEAVLTTSVAALTAAQAAVLIANAPGKLPTEALLQFTKRMTELLAAQVALSP